MVGTTLVTGRRIPWNAVHELHIGPYAGGINRYSDISAINESEMADCINFDISLDGSLQSRPPWRLLYQDNAATTPSSTVTPSFQLILGSYTYNGVRQVFFYSDTINTGTPGFGIYFFDGVNAGTVQLIAAGRFSKSVRYGDKVYLIPDLNHVDDNGIEYDLTTGIATSAPLKRGYSCVIYKDRLWITGRRGLTPESRLFFSDPGNMKSFQSTSFFDINPGDGDATQDLVVYQDNLIIYKDSATYVLTFDTNPAQAALQMVNADVGVSGPRCVIPYENSIFVMQYNQVYEMVNYDFTRISVKIPFEYDATLPDTTSGYAWKDPIWLGRIGDRLIARFYNRLYVYHLRLRAWTRWESKDTNIQYIGYVLLVDNTNTGLRRGFNSYVATSSLNAQQDSVNIGAVTGWNKYQKLFIMDDRYENTFVENGNSILVANDISCSMQTKAFDLGYTHRFKHLMSWGIDVITGRDTTGIAIPFAVVYSATWQQLANYQWHQLNTWQYPLLQIPSNTVTQPIGAGLNRRFIRFPKSLRFRLIQFQVNMVTTGNTVDGPARMYSVTALVSARQLAPKAVN